MTKPAAWIIAILITLAVIMAGCGEKITPNDTATVNYKQIIDGCEYIQIGTTFGMVHKGNCSNPIHCYCDTLKTTK